MSAGDGTDEVAVVAVVCGEILDVGGDDDDDSVDDDVDVAAAAAAAATVVWLRRCDIRSSLDENRRPQKSAPLIQLQTNAPPMMEDVDVDVEPEDDDVGAETDVVEGDGVAGGTVADADVVAKAAMADAADDDDGEGIPNIAAAAECPAAVG